MTSESIAEEDCILTSLCSNVSLAWCWWWWWRGGRGICSRAGKGLEMVAVVALVLEEREKEERDVLVFKEP